MSAATYTGEPVAGRSPARRLLSGAAVQNVTLWLLIASGSIAFIEPSPFEVMFVVAGLVFIGTGLSIPRESIPLLALLVLFNIGGLISLVDVANDPRAVTFVAISLYLACVTLFFVMLMLKNTERRLDIIFNAQIVTAVVAGIAGLLGYFNVMGLSSVFTIYGTRASGMFKDPNVFSPFIAIAATALFHDLITGRTRRFWLSLVTLGFLSFAVLLSFSRGGWGVLILSLLMVVGLNLLVSRTWRQRRRIIIVAIVGAVGLVVAGMAALSAPSISAMFTERAKLLQSYDSGETGRFGKQKRSIPQLLELPNGFGPLQFSKKFVENPHNVYIFAFSSYGWLGGIAYFALIVTTCVLGWTLVFQRTPFQTYGIVVWCALFPQILQGFQIDTDHWRHFWWLLGITWGLSIVSNRWMSARSADAGDAPAS